MKKMLTLALVASMMLAMSVNSFALGNYVVAEPTEEDEILDEIDSVPEEDVSYETPDEGNIQKPNPQTGAEDFAGAAAAAAVIAGIGFTALKKR